MEDNKILSPHYLEAYEYSYSVVYNEMHFKQKRNYYSLDQVLENRSEPSSHEFVITFVKVINGGKTMHKYVVYDDNAYDMYDGNVEYRKTRVFVLTGISDDDRKSLEHVVNIGYRGLYYNLVGMDSTTYDFKTYVIDWESDDDWKVGVFDEPDEDRTMCMDFMATLADNQLDHMTKDGMDTLTWKCVKYGFMRETPAPPVYLKDILLDKDFDDNNEDIPF